MKEQFTLSIRSILIVGFGGLIIVGIVMALYLGLSTAFQNTQELLTDKAETLVTRLVDEIDDRLRPVEAQAKWIADRVNDGRLNVRNPDAPHVNIIFDAILAATPQVGGVGLLLRDGIMRQWLRGSDEVIIADWSNRQSIMDWLDSGEKGPKTEWGPPIWLDTLNASVIIHQTSLFDDQGYLGYLTIAVPVADLSRHLSRLSTNSFILVGQNDVLAHSLMIDWRPMDQSTVASADSIYQGRSALVPLTEIGDSILEEIWSDDYHDLVMLQNMADTRAVVIKIGEKQYIFLHRTIKRYGPVAWTVGAYLNAETSSDEVKRLVLAIIIGFCILIASVILCLLLARSLVRPIRALAKASDVVGKGQFDDIPSLPVSRITELNRAMNSFDMMVKGLAEKEIIRQTLGRYVPEAIAEILLKDGGGLQPREAEATILFTDIAGFTALTEALGPSRIVEVLNAYFSRMTEIIEANNGVITQFQGDAILAIFNVPIEAPDHAELACNAAMLMRTAVGNETFAGEKLKCRIGINTGPVVAGAVGAEGRLTYTVHGDAVNRAARVEAMNKEVGTEILLTEATACLLENISVRKIDIMKIRGQSDTVTIYTIDT